jgi:hypothetical protein
MRASLPGFLVVLFLTLAQPASRAWGQQSIIGIGVLLVYVI